MCLQSDKMGASASQLAGYTQLLQGLAVEGIQAAFKIDGTREEVRSCSRSLLLCSHLQCY